METLNEYGATSCFGVNTMVTGIFQAWFSLGDVRSALKLAGVSGTLSVTVSLIIFYVRNRLGEKKGARMIAIEALHSGNAVPGVIIVMVILTLSNLVERVSSLFLFGSLGLLAYAYIVRYLAITTKPIQAVMSKIPTSFDDACLLSGRQTAHSIFTVHLPLL